MLHISTPPASNPSSSSSFATRKGAQPQPTTPLSSMSPSSHLTASAVLIVPIYDETNQGADLLMIPISDKKSPVQTQAATTSTTSPESHSPRPTTGRTETPAAPTPPPKPRLPEGCDDWDSYLSQKKSTATLARYGPDADADEVRAPQEEDDALPRLQSPELNFKHSFEHLGWRDCLAPSTRQRAHARALRRRPSAATVYTAAAATAGVVSSSALSLRSAKRLSNASTLTVATAPCILTRSSSSGTSTSRKRLSAASTLTTSSIGSTASNGKPRSLRRINRTRHLRAYYSDMSLAPGSRGGGGGGGARRLSLLGINGSIAERREPSSAVAGSSSKRLSSVSMLSGEFSAPPPYPPPEKPLPSLPVVEVRELQTGERARWRELLLRSLQRMEGSRKRAASPWRGWTPRAVEV